MTYLKIIPFDLWKELSHYYLPTVEINNESIRTDSIRTHNLIFNNIHLISRIDNIKHIEAENVFYDYCDKYVTKFSLRTPDRFHGVKKLYLNSSPADYDAFDRFYSPKIVCLGPSYLSEQYKDLKIYLHERFKRYYDRWWTNHENLFIISDTEYQQIFEEAKSFLELRN